MIMRLTTQNSNYNLPESFRGIGSICTMKGGYIGVSSNPNYERACGDEGDEDGKYTLQLYGFEGNGSTINVNLKYNTYGNSDDNYISTVYGTNSTANNSNVTEATNSSYKGVHIGFGLFNYVRQEKETGNTTGYNTKTGYYIGNFDLTGNVTVNEYDNNGSLMNGDGTNSNGVNRVRTRHSVGGVVGVTVSNDYLNMYKLKLLDFSVSGTSMVGGYVGRCNITGKDPKSGKGKIQFYANCCNTENLSVSARGGYSAGMVAGLATGYLDLFVNTAPNTGALAGDDGYSKSSLSVSVSNSAVCQETGTGGLLGACRTGVNNIWINNVTLSGIDDTTKAYVKDTGNRSEQSAGVGGLMGYIRKAGTIIITNTTVKNIDITGTCVGGMFGYIDNPGINEWGDSATIRIYNSKILNDSTNTHKIEGQYSAGGISGYFITSRGSGETAKWDSTGDKKYNQLVIVNNTRFLFIT